MKQSKELIIGLLVIGGFLLACSWQEQSFYVTGSQKNTSNIVALQGAQN